MPGESLGPYRLDAELGAGGMGKVWRATATRRTGCIDPGSVVALKVVHPHLLETEGFFKRFLREAEIGKAVVHPNVVRTLDCDAVGGAHFLVMEYVEGQTLRGLLEELGRVPEELCRHVGREVAKGLAAIHAGGVIHRDLKPENVLITKDHTVKVMDLGIARLADEALRLSQSGAFVGSVQYAAPEQFRDAASVDGRSDLHALGVVLYELATARHPFQAGDFREAMRHVLETRPRRAGELNPQLTPFFEEFVAHLLEKAPARRPASAADAARLLDEAEHSAWWQERARTLRVETRRPLRRVRVPRETALHGREAEIAKLRALYERAKSGEGQVVLVEGEAGIGKSRVVDEFVAQLRAAGEDVNFLFGSYPPSGAATASGAFSTAYREQLGDDEEAIAAALPQTPLLVPAFAALLRGDATPKDAEPLRKDSLQAVFVHATASLAGERTTIVLIDDLHFAPEEGRALFAALANAAPELRVLLVGTARPGLEERWLADLERLGRTTRLPLQRLGPKEVAALLLDALRSERLAEELGFRILQKSDGNPFFVFEILRGLREGQFIAKRDDGTWVGTRVIQEIQLPSSVLELVQARVAGLSADERDLLDVASCLGFEFDPALLAEVAGRPRIATLKALSQVERAHRLVRSAGRRFVFDHHQVQEALYGSLPEMLREEYHAAIGDALERTSGAAAAASPEALDGSLCVDLAEHFLKGAQGARASRYVLAGGGHLFHVGLLPQAALSLHGRALAAPGCLAGDERCKALMAAANAEAILGRSDAAASLLDQALPLSEGAERKALRASVLGARVLALSMTRDYASVEAEARRWLAAAVDAGERRATAAAQGCLSLFLLWQGRFDEARAIVGRLSASAEGETDEQILHEARRARTHLAELEGRAEDAIADSAALIAAHRAPGRLHSLDVMLGNHGMLLHSTGRLAEALAAFEEAVLAARQSAHVAGIGWLSNVASLDLQFGRPEDAERHALEGLEASRASGETAWVGLGLRVLAASAAERGDLSRAAALFDEAAETIRPLGAGTWFVLALVDRARALVACDRSPEAAACLAEAGALAVSSQRPGDLLTLLAARAALLGTGVDEARAAWAGSIGRPTDFDRAGVAFDLWRATRDAEFLAEAKRELDHLVSHAPPDRRASMLANVRLHREIAEAAAAAE